MAKQNNETDPLIQLTEENKQHLDAMEKDLKAAEDDLAALDELDIDTTRLKERVAWAKKARDVIKKRLS